MGSASCLLISREGFYSGESFSYWGATGGAPEIQQEEGKERVLKQNLIKQVIVTVFINIYH